MLCRVGEPSGGDFSWAGPLSFSFVHRRMKGELVLSQSGKGGQRRN